MMSNTPPLHRALISVSDKAGIVPFAKALTQRGVEILSTGGTAKLLKENQILVTEISHFTGFPEIMDGRLKTLHPKIFGGILGRRDLDQAIMKDHELPNIDLVVVNLYPFEATVASDKATLSDAIENIDIGGPSLIRAAAKNYAWCTVVTDTADYEPLLAELDQHQGAITQATRFKLAQKAFGHTAYYDGVISNYLSKQTPEGKTEVFPDTLNLQYQLRQPLRYGENPHQQAAFYVKKNASGISQATQLQGKALSYNNILDGDAALRLIQSFTETACVIVKHTNPCGVAIAPTSKQAYETAYASDPQSAFGGIIAFNQPVDEMVMESIITNQFVELILAPEFSSQAVAVASSKPNCRLLQYSASKTQNPIWELRGNQGSLLIQNHPMTDDKVWETVTQTKPSEAQMKDLRFAWQVVKAVKSNAIVLAKDLKTLGIGPGQTSRIFSVEIAQKRALQNHFDLKGAVLASDAFFPFQDSIEQAHQMGIKAIIQPGGAQRDQEVIARANELGIAMIFTHTRHFSH